MPAGTTPLRCTGCCFVLRTFWSETRHAGMVDWLLVLLLLPSSGPLLVVSRRTSHKAFAAATASPSSSNDAHAVGRARLPVCESATQRQW